MESLNNYFSSVIGNQGLHWRRYVIISNENKVDILRSPYLRIVWVNITNDGKWLLCILPPTNAHNNVHRARASHIQETAQANLRKPTDAIKRGHFVILEQFTTAVI